MSNRRRKNRTFFVYLLKATCTPHYNHSLKLLLKTEKRKRSTRDCRNYNTPQPRSENNCNAIMNSCRTSISAGSVVVADEQCSPQLQSKTDANLGQGKTKLGREQANTGKNIHEWKEEWEIYARSVFL